MALMLSGLAPRYLESGAIQISGWSIMILLYFATRSKVPGGA